MNGYPVQYKYVELNRLGLNLVDTVTKITTIIKSITKYCNKVKYFTRNTIYLKQKMK